MPSMTIRGRIGLMIFAFVGGLGLLAALSIWAGAKVQVNGPAYRRIVEQKDIVAEVHPPAAYAVEAYLAIHQVTDEQDRRRAVGEVHRLFEEFEASYGRWAATLPKGPIAEAAEKAHRTGTLFRDRMEGTVLPLLQEKRDVEGEGALSDAEPLFAAHRAAVARLSGLLAASIQAAEADAQIDVTRHRWLELLLAAATALAVGLLAFLIGHRIDRSIRALSAEITSVSAAVERGELNHRADSGAVSPEFRPVVEALNRSVQAFVTPVELTADFVDRIGRGDLPPPVTARFQGEFARITGSLDRCSASLRDLLGEMERMAAAHERGEVDVMIDATRFEGAYASVASGVNSMVGSHLADQEMALMAFQSFGLGNFAIDLPRLPGKKAAINDTIDQVRGNLDGLVAEMSRMSTEQEGGDVDAAIDLERFQGDWRAMAEGVNGMAARHVALTRRLLGCLEAFGAGDFQVTLEPLPGKLRAVNETVDQVRGRLEALVVDADRLAEAARAGHLDARADPERHAGGFRRIVAGMNGTFDALDRPLREATRVLSRMATRDITARITMEFQGQHAALVDAVNGTSSALASALLQVNQAVHQVSTAADEIAAAATSVAGGASAQAGEVEQIRLQLDGIGEMTRSTSARAARAEGLAAQANGVASSGATVMAGLNDAMAQIKSSAGRTSQIIRDINDIAFQTNLLALNAAVEAARAGDAGRGFAVVAEEVRSLAARCKEAAQKTEALIQESVGQATGGEAAAHQVGAMLGQIQSQVSEVTSTVTDIASAARDQAASIQQLEAAVGQVEKVMQQTAASAEESSAAAMELNGQSETLGAMIGTFRLSEEAAGLRGARRPPALRAVEG